TESDWLSSTDPQPMLQWLQGSGQASDRKLRLFRVACCRSVWHLMTDDRSRALVEVVEAVTDGTAIPEEAHRLAGAAPYYEGHVQPGPVHIFASDAAVYASLPNAWDAAFMTASDAASALIHAP